MAGLLRHFAAMVTGHSLQRRLQHGQSPRDRAIVSHGQWCSGVL